MAYVGFGVWRWKGTENIHRLHFQEYCFIDCKKENMNGKTEMLRKSLFLFIITERISKVKF